MNKKKKVWRFTHVHHPVRIMMKLTVNEYCVLDLIYQSQVSPSYTVNGWSDRSYQKIADFIGISKSTVHSIVSNAVIKGFAEFNLDNIKLKKTTSAWYDFAYFEEVTPELIAEFKKRSKIERSETEQKRSETEQKRSETEQHTNKYNKVSNTLHKEKMTFNSSEDVKQVISKKDLKSDTPENRIELWKIYELWLTTESFKTQWDFYADRAPDVEAKPLMKVWVTKAPFYDVKSVKINLIQGWVKRAQDEFNRLKLVNNGKSRNHKNLQSADNAANIFRKLQQEGI